MNIARSAPTLVFCALSLGLCVAVLLRPTPSIADAPPFKPYPVKTGHPKFKEVSGPYVEQPATVEAYYSINVYSDVAGRIVSMPKEVGQTVIKDDVLAMVLPSGGGSAPVPILSPLSGHISGRNANPGDFAVNPAVVPGASALVSVIRNDIVTVNVRVPDADAAHIGLQTPAYFRPDGHEGPPFRLTISRMTPSMAARDRTIGIEMDVFNQSENEYSDLVSRNTAKPTNEFKGGVIPQFPDSLKGTQRGLSLMPGTYGQVRFDLKSPEGALSIPASCIVMEGGVSYAFKVESGHVLKRVVEIRQDDGVYVSLFWVTKDPQSGMKMATPIKAEDEIVLSNQGELEVGQLVSSVPTDW